MQNRKILLGLVLILLLFVPAFLIIPRFSSTDSQNSLNAKASEEFMPTSKKEFGFYLDSFIVYQRTIRPSEFLANILLPYNVSYSTIHDLVMRSVGIFEVRKIAAGKDYVVLCSKTDSARAEYFIYQPNEVEYIVYDLRDTVKIWKGQKEVEIAERLLGGEIKTSLYDALTGNGGNAMLSLEMAEILAWTVDFYRIQRGDWFKIVYEEKMVDGKPIGFGNILALQFNHEGRDFHGFYFEQDSMTDYFDENANSLRKAFLKSPLKYSRLTSGYTKRRFHPVQKRWKAHLGTDYAAPNGTPILATGDGKVVEARYKRFNGNYVKIKHNGTYTTQYLHMSSIKKGIKPGSFVKQGEVIGYVGSTGLATGPHVCYRFWKNGDQVNHLNEEFPPSEPVKTSNMEEYRTVMSKYKSKLGQISLSNGDDMASVH